MDELKTYVDAKEEDRKELDISLLALTCESCERVYLRGKDSNPRDQLCKDCCFECFGCSTRVDREEVCGCMRCREEFCSDCMSSGFWMVEEKLCKTCYIDSDSEEEAGEKSDSDEEEEPPPKKQKTEE